MLLYTPFMNGIPEKQGTSALHKKNSTMFFLIGLIVLFVALVIGSIQLVKQVYFPIITTPTLTPTPTPDPMAPKNIVFLGYAGGKHDGGALTDTIIVFHIIPKEKRAVLVSIPRDLWVELPLYKDTTTPYKINAAYAFGSDTTQFRERPDMYKGTHGGGNLAKYAAGTVIGQPIDYYISVNFDGFVRIIHALGKITITVPFSFEDRYYPLEGKETDTCGKSEEDMQKTTATLSGFLLEKEFPCRYETVKFDRGVVVMDGETALKFVRSRHSDTNGGDFGRSMRQQAFLLGIKNKLLSFGEIPKIISVITNSIQSVSTDLSISDITSMANRYGSLSDYTIANASLSEDNVLTASVSAKGQYILVPKNSWDDVHTFFLSTVEMPNTRSADMSN